MSFGTGAETLASPGRARRTTSWTVGVLIVLVGLLAVSDLLLVVQNRNLKKELGKPTVSGQRRLYLQEGDVLPALHAFSRDGTPTTVGFEGGRSTVFAVFSPQCSWSLRNLKIWKQLAAVLDPARFRMIGVSTLPQGLGPYVEKHGLGSIEILSEPDPRDFLAYKLDLTPQTVLVNPRGEVEHIWLGALGLQDVVGIETALGVDLTSATSTTELLVGDLPISDSGLDERTGPVSVQRP